jgi:Protein kinase domain
VNADRWRQVNALFHEAVELDAPRRDALLLETARTDPELAHEVRSLLSRHAPQNDFLEEPAWAVAADLMFDKDESIAGRQIGPYRIIREIGRGGMGVVYAARDERLGRVVALKALPSEYAANRRHRERLAREARAAAALTHESIAMVFALEEIDGALYMTSELVEGHTLREELSRGPTPVNQLLPTLIAIASGLAAAHARGVIHRDLKPDNVIRRADGQIKILDFGLARIDDPRVSTTTRLTEPGTAPGTPGYMAPEQLSGGDTDARTDLFAFGVLAWEIATGQHPFGSNPALMLARMMEGRPATLSRQLPIPALEPIVRRCLRAASSERYASAEVLLEDLRRLASGSGSQHVMAATLDASGLWWWQFHQITVTIVDAAAPVLAGLASASMPRGYAMGVIYSALGLATAAVTLRLNLLFTARVHPAMLATHRATLFRWIAGAEALLAVLMLGASVVVSNEHPIVAGVLVSLAIIMLASLAVIEPATTRGAGLYPPSSRDTLPPPQ